MADNHYDLFLDEIKGLKDYSDEELNALAQKLPDESAKNQLIEGSLAFVVITAQSYLQSGVDIEDLVGEGNMAVVILAEHFKSGDFAAMRKKAVELSMQQLVDEQQGTDSVAKKLAASINVLNEVATRLAAQLGRQATVSEIAEKMKISEDEVEILMRTAVNAIALDREGAAEDAEREE